MTKLEQLIEELCPNGVEYHELGKIAEMRRGTSITKKNVCEGEIPVISGGREPAYYCDTFNREGATITVAGSGAGAGYVQYWDRPIFVCDAFSIKGNERLSTKYLYYFLTSIQEFIYSTKKGGGVPHVHVSSIEHVQIPVPPLPVQSEIVRILDNFTELTAELTARKKQYEFYRDKLLTFGDARGGATSDVVWRTLAEIADISTGSSNTDDAVEGGCYPFFVRSQQPLAKDEYEYDEEAIITAGDGVGVGKVFHYINGKYALHQRAYRIHPATDGLLGKYLYHYFVATFPKYIGQQMYQGSVPSIRRPMLNKFQVAIPSLDVQKRIVNVLDNFDAICSDLKIGLPAEIEARKKQYEFYRDALLTYAATGKIILTDRQTDRQTIITH